MCGSQPFSTVHVDAARRIRTQSRGSGLLSFRVSPSEGFGGFRVEFSKGLRAGFEDVFVCCRSRIVA